MKEIEITFVREYEVKDGSGARYKKGQIARVSEPSANHFINRGAAVLTADIKKASAEKAAAEKAEADRIAAEKAAAGKGQDNKNK